MTGGGLVYIGIIIGTLLISLLVFIATLIVLKFIMKKATLPKLIASFFLSIMIITCIGVSILLFYDIHFAVYFLFLVVGTIPLLLVVLLLLLILYFLYFIFKHKTKKRDITPGTLTYFLISKSWFRGMIIGATVGILIGLFGGWIFVFITDLLHKYFGLGYNPIYGLIYLLLNPLLIILSYFHSNSTDGGLLSLIVLLIGGPLSWIIIGAVVGIIFGYLFERLKK